MRGDPKHHKGRVGPLRGVSPDPSKMEAQYQALLAMKFDGRLVALASCPVVAVEHGGGMLFNPHPIVHADTDPTLAHEVCHVLAGGNDYFIFNTSLIARSGGEEQHEGWGLVLNVLYDWYHEYKLGHYSGFLWNRLTDLHATCDRGLLTKLKVPALDEIERWYFDRETDPASVGVHDAIDLVRVADEVYKEVEKVGKAPDLAKLAKANRRDVEDAIVDNKDGDRKGEFIDDKIIKGRITGAGGDVGHTPIRSNYYFKAVAKYWCIIEELSTLWKRNRYGWKSFYYGEIDWKDLPGLFIGDKMSLPVFRLLLNLRIARSVFLMIDRSRSTSHIKEVIMDTAIIITESLRILDIPVSILDVGPQNKVVNRINEPLDLSWFTPTARNGTPLGKVGLQIRGADINSYLLIVTDGCPDCFGELKQALAAFPGHHFTFVIGDSFPSYRSQIQNAVSVEPHTIIREILHDETLS